MEELKFLDDFNNKILSIYEREELYPLSGKDDSYLLPNGKQILSWHNEVTRHRNCHFSPDYYSYYSNIKDLLFICDELVYFTAHLYLYKPYINTSMKDAYKTPNGDRIYPAFQKVHDKRFEMYFNVCYEKVYNYWGRIGDLIASFFPTQFNGNIYFSRVLQDLKSKYMGCSDFDWLLNFSETEYKNFNDSRKKTVHKTGVNTENYLKQLGQVTDAQKSRELTSERLNYPDEFKKMNSQCIEGIQRTLSFLEHVNKTENYQCI